ncbi:phosphatase PAP2 family protein [Pedobacter sp. UYP24]
MTNKRILFRFILLLTLSFLLLTVLVLLFPKSSIDLKFSHEVQEHQFLLLDQFMEMISWLGNLPQNLIVVGMTALAFWFLKFKREGVFILLTLISGLISTILKFLVDRPRPTQNLVRILEKAKQQSFPSGHVLFYVVFFGFLIFLMFHLDSLNIKLRWIVACFSGALIILIPFSRIYLGAHWFTDVLAGFMVGVIILYLLCSVYLSNYKSSKLN